MKFIAYLELMRLNSLYGALFGFFPCIFGFINSNQLHNQFFDSKYFSLFLVLTFLGRTFGCVVNDIVDSDLDSKVQRTQFRPLASGVISKLEAIQILGFLGFLMLIVLSYFNTRVIFVSLIYGILTFIYPFMKRITYMPQIFLGIVINCGALLVPLQIKGQISVNDFLIYLGCLCWTISYDTFYGFCDLEDDSKHQIKSLSRKLKSHLYVLYIINYAALVFLLCGKNRPNDLLTVISTILYIILVYWQVKFFDFKIKNDGMIRFKFNIFIGMLICLILS